MLIGPTLTVSELEKHMMNQREDNESRIISLANELNKMADELSSMKKYLINDDGDRVPNDEYYDLLSTVEEQEDIYIELQESNDFIKRKLSEIEELEENTNNQFDKEKQKITLTLNDCMLLGVEEVQE